MAGRICTSLDAMCISHEASHDTHLFAVLGPRLQGQSARPPVGSRQVVAGQTGSGLLVVLHVHFNVTFWPLTYVPSAGSTPLLAYTVCMSLAKAMQRQHNEYGDKVSVWFILLTPRHADE